MGKLQDAFRAIEIILQKTDFIMDLHKILPL